jgi:Thioredoxin like C-terminal domain
VIQQLLAEAGKGDMPGGMVSVSATGAEAASDEADVKSPETYIGFTRSENFASPGGAVGDKPHDYSLGDLKQPNDWGLSGDWTVGGQSAMLNKTDGTIAFRFHARDLHLVLGPGAGGKPVRFRVTIDGSAPGENHGADVNADREGVVPIIASISSSAKAGRSWTALFSFLTLTCGRTHLPLARGFVL